MKRYLIPMIEVVELDERDCICASVLVDEDGTVDNVGRIPNAWFNGVEG